MQNNNVEVSSLLPSLLLVLFVGLKLGGVITWSWLWVLSPLWIPLAIVLVIMVIFIVVAAAAAAAKAVRDR